MCIIMVFTGDAQDLTRPVSLSFPRELHAWILGVGSSLYLSIFFFLFFSPNHARSGLMLLAWSHPKPCQACESGQNHALPTQGMSDDQVHNVSASASPVSHPSAQDSIDSLPPVTHCLGFPTSNDRDPICLWDDARGTYSGYTRLELPGADLAGAAEIPG